MTRATAPEATRDPATSSTEGLVVDSLVRASFLTMAVLSRVAAAHDVSLTQLRVLAILRDRRVMMSELAEYLGLDRSTVSGLVDRAERRVLLQRVAHPDDGRGVQVVITEAGARLAAQGADEVAAGLAASIGRLTPAEGRRLAALLDRL